MQIILSDCMLEGSEQTRHGFAAKENQDMRLPFIVCTNVEFSPGERKL